MKLTKEQNDIIYSSGNIKINAVAGSGKTTTIIEYAKARPRTSKILYLAFNKSVKNEAVKKFADEELYNVSVETAHSLAYRYIVFKNQYKVKSHGYKTNEIVELLNLHGNGEKHAEHILASHINKLVSCFCNSDKCKVRDIDYLSTISDSKAKNFVYSFLDYILFQSRLFLDKMNRGEIEITHDFYLKKFQLSNPKLNYDYILFDEAQDASPVMLDIFFKQNATKVIVGDTYQQIYGWRFAVNSLEKVDFKSYNLSTSFRFNQEIANLAMDVLKYKHHINDNNSIVITGKGDCKETKSKAVIARTNLGLLLKAIEYTIEKKRVKSIYFEGNINSYTYADDGASLYDVLNLYNEKHELIQDKLIKEMKSLYELEEYVEKTEDSQLSMMVEIVREYGNKIPKIIQIIKSKHIKDDDKKNAEIIFSTVHRCKGMEYDTIQLVNDFISEKKLEKFMENGIADENNAAKLNEEINLLYVAVTRTKNSIYIPEDLVPNKFPTSSQIHIIKTINQEQQNQQKTSIVIPKTRREENTQGKAYSLTDIRTKYKEAYRPWTDELDKQLTIMYCEGLNIRDMAQHFGRTRGAIVSRIKKLELEELYG